MTIEDLPYYIDHEIEYDDGQILEHKFFLSINRDSYGKWSCGYVAFASEEHEEFAIPQLVTNSSDTLDEIAIRMSAKINRFRKNHEI